MRTKNHLSVPGWAWIVWGIVLVGTFVVAPHLPHRIAIHYGVNGQPNQEANRWIGAFILPALMFALLVGWRGLWRIDPKRANYESMTATYRYLGGLMVVFLGLIQGWILLQSLQALWDPQRLIGTLIGALIVLLSNVLPRVRANWWIGIRTPWTLSSDEVWRRTHLIGGQTGVITGLLIVIGTWMVPTRWTTELALAFIMAWALLTTVASYWYSTHLETKGTES